MPCKRYSEALQTSACEERVPMIIYTVIHVHSILENTSELQKETI